jgi:hypothetical protein
VMRNGAAAYVAAVVLLAAAAPSATAYPTHVSNTYRVTTNNPSGGQCEVSPVAWAHGTVLGSLEGVEYVSCNFSPYSIYLDGGFSDTSLDVLNVTSDTAGDSRRCEWWPPGYTCNWGRQRGYFPAGDHYVSHEVVIDLHPQSYQTQQFSSFPPGCSVAASDRGRLTCVFKQWVTVPTPVSG